jgi:hypothetical protein
MVRAQAKCFDKGFEDRTQNRQTLQKSTDSQKVTTIYGERAL